MTGTNLVVVTVGVEIVTNTAHFQQRLQTIIQRAGGSQTNLVRGADRKAIVSKLDKIRLDHVSYDHLPLGEVLRQLAAEIKKRDPDKEGVNFLLQTAADTSANLPTVDPQTGLPATNTKPAGHDEINSVLITIPNLTDVRAADVLDAIVLTADKPIRYSIQDYAVFFSSKVAEIPQFFARTFRVNIATLRVGLKSIRLQQFGSNTNIDTDISTLSAAQVAREFFTGLGVDLKSPPGKSVFYNDRLGMLYVKATQSDLDIIERALSALMPPVLQIHIKARFVEVPKADSAGFDWYLGTLPAINSSNSKPNLFGGVFPGGGQPAGSSTEAGHITGILTDSNLNLVLHALNQRKAEFLAEPEVTTLSGRRTVIKATEDRSVITNMAYQEIGTNQNGIVVSNSILPQTERVEIGPILDCTATVLADGYTINLAVTPSLTEFAGYAKTTGLKIARNRAGEKIEVPEVFPIFRIRQATTDIKVMDDQTLVIGGMPEKFVTAGKGHESASNSSNKELLVFITATIVDQAGNRVHPDDSSGGIPPPPVPSK
jgi:type II secretory pathway component GspD/PulD (secretin)